MRTRSYELTEDDQITLGELIDGLEQADPARDVYLDWNRLGVAGLGSYRGYYDQLAIGYADDGNAMTAGDLLKDCRAAVGAHFEGYKGGQFRMDRNTRIYVANHGSSAGVGLVGIKLDSGGGVTLQTDIVDDIYK
jgi:hypothetical protein